MQKQNNQNISNLNLETKTPDYNDTIAYHFFMRYEQPEFMEACEHLLDEIGIKKSELNKNNMQSLLSNLLLQQTQHGERWIIYGRSKKDWNTKSKEDNRRTNDNPYRISHGITKLIDGLRDSGFIEELKGYRGAEKSRLSRMRALPKLNDEIFRPAQLYKLTPSTHKDFETIRAKDNNKKPIPLSKSKKKQAHESIINDYNNLLAQQDIYIPDRKSSSNPSERKYSGACPVYRVFNNKELNEGGRVYGAWWQECRSGLRKHIMINDEETIEIDCKSQHPYLLYDHMPYAYFYDDKDPYLLHNKDGQKYPRGLVKKVMNTCLNSDNENQAYNAVKKELQTDKKKPNKAKQKEAETLYERVRYIKDFREIVSDIFTKHKFISNYLYSGIGKHLQYLDSEITVGVIGILTSQNIPVLTVHDSFIVQERYEEQLREAIYIAYSSFSPHGIPECEEDSILTSLPPLTKK